MIYLFTYIIDNHKNNEQIHYFYDNGDICVVSQRGYMIWKWSDSLIEDNNGISISQKTNITFEYELPETLIIEPYHNKGSDMIIFFRTLYKYIWHNIYEKLL